jgi:hypothetical protein
MRTTFEARSVDTETSTFAAVGVDWRSDRVDEIRSLIRQAEPDAIEEAKWRKPSNPDGVPTFSLDGLICTIETYKDKVKLTFAKGASLNDPSHLFNASLDAGVRRAINLYHDDHLDADAFIALIREAVRANRT